MSMPDEMTATPSTVVAKPKYRWEHSLTFTMRGIGKSGDLCFSSKEKMAGAMVNVTEAMIYKRRALITHISGSAFIDCSEVVAITAHSLRSRDYGNDDY